MSILTPEDHQKIIQRAIKDQTLSILSFKISPAAEHQDGFFGDTFILDITYKLETVNTRKFFVKTMPESSEHAEMAKSLRAYDKEIFFYDFLVREYQTRGYNTSFVPECYLCKNGRTLVMDELTNRGYCNLMWYDLEVCKSALKSLANFHGASMLYEEQKSTETGKTFRFDEEYPFVFEERFFTLKNEDCFIYKHFKVSIKCLEELVRFLPEKEETKREFVERVKEKYLKIDELFNADLGMRKVCSHGDLWRRNIMFQKDSFDCRIVDFQMLRYFHPVFDFLTLLFFCTKRELRKKHMDELIKFYYETLSTATNGVVESVLPLKDFLLTMEHFEFVVAYQTFAGHLLDIDDNVTADTEILFGNRAKYACREFERSERYRQLVIDDMYTLFDSVFDVSIF